MASQQSHSGHKVERRTPDLSEYPDLVVIYLGMKAKSLRGVKTAISFGPQIQKSVAAKPDGLLRHENLFYSLVPLHPGMRQYWRDFESLEKWSRTGIHKQWWQRYLRDTEGTAFWHELYMRNGEMEGAFIEIEGLGLTSFAPAVPSRGTMFSARRRLQRAGDEEAPSVYSEEELYGAGS